MPANYLSIRVELVSGHGEYFWPRPGRVFLASKTHSFALLSDAIDEAFARWDRSHLWVFDLPDGTHPTRADPYGDWKETPRAVDGARTKLSRLKLGERFIYTFDLGDEWTHLCTVGEEAVDPDDMWGKPPGGPRPYFGWGTIPDQYGRQSEDDEVPVPPPLDPPGSDLPALAPEWDEFDE